MVTLPHMIAGPSKGYLYPIRAFFWNVKSRRIRGSSVVRSNRIDHISFVLTSGPFLKAMQTPLDTVAVPSSY